MRDATELRAHILRYLDFMATGPALWNSAGPDYRYWIARHFVEHLWQGAAACRECHWFMDRSRLGDILARTDRLGTDALRQAGRGFGVLRSYKSDYVNSRARPH